MSLRYCFVRFLCRSTDQLPAAGVIKSGGACESGWSPSVPNENRCMILIYLFSTINKPCSYGARKNVLLSKCCHAPTTVNPSKALLPTLLHDTRTPHHLGLSPKMNIPWISEVFIAWCGCHGRCCSSERAHWIPLVPWVFLAQLRGHHTGPSSRNKILTDINSSIS